jgi:hypothetical protein
VDEHRRKFLLASPILRAYLVNLLSFFVQIHLLKEAVQVLGHGQHPDAAKISWMEVSIYISNHGGTYKFGYSTCHRRWEHLEATGQLGANWVDESWEGYYDDEDGDEDEGEDGEVEGGEDDNETEVEDGEEDDVAPASED